jgi:hypothetical protein
MLRYATELRKLLQNFLRYALQRFLYSLPPVTKDYAHKTVNTIWLNATEASKGRIKFRRKKGQLATLKTTFPVRNSCALIASAKFT